MKKTMNREGKSNGLHFRTVGSTSNSSISGFDSNVSWKQLCSIDSLLSNISLNSFSESEFIY